MSSSTPPSSSPGSTRTVNTTSRPPAPAGRPPGRDRACLCPRPRRLRARQRAHPFAALDRRPGRRSGRGPVGHRQPTAAPHPAGRVAAATLTAEHRLTYYDASWAAVARVHDAPLVSADRELLGAGLALTASRFVAGERCLRTAREPGILSAGACLLSMTARGQWSGTALQAVGHVGTWEASDGVGDR